MSALVAVLAGTSLAPSCAGGGDHDDDPFGVQRDSKRGLRHGAIQGVIVVKDGEKLVPTGSFTCIDAPAGSPGYLEVDPQTHEGIRCQAAAPVITGAPILRIAQGERFRILTSSTPGGVLVAGIPPGFEATDGQAVPQLRTLGRAVQADKAGHRWDVRLRGRLDYPGLQIQLLSQTPGVGPVAGFDLALAASD